AVPKCGTGQHGTALQCARILGVTSNYPPARRVTSGELRSQYRLFVGATTGNPMCGPVTRAGTPRPPPIRTAPGAAVRQCRVVSFQLTCFHLVGKLGDGGVGGLQQVKNSVSASVA